MEMASCSAVMQNQSKAVNAFDELGPYSAPKSTEPWDIFISHCGRDVKHTLATTIFHKLHSAGLHVFLDLECLEPGDSIPAELQHAIASAPLHIAIFSPNYAQSSWCLSELTFMLESGSKIIPIFYHVEPSDLRWVEQGRGKYADAFSDHENKGRYTREKLDKWKRALQESSFLSGYVVNNNKDEAVFLKNIVNCVFQIMKKAPLWVAKNPIGLDELIRGFELVGKEERVKIRGVVGMGGSGKTTLAKELFNRNFSYFERCSFVFDVRDAASKNALPDKQKMLLADLGVHHLPFDNVDQGMVVLANRLNSHRSLIVLDDVDHINQLNALLPNPDNLGSHSMVIVTTRDLGVLKSWSLSCIYNMPGLNMSHAQQLFCWHAFLQPSPPPEYETLVQEFLNTCNGLPLSLKVLGEQLCGRKSKDYWESQLHKIPRILPGEIKQRLQVSYNGLDEEEREMFLDVACFLIGERASRAIAVWDKSGWSGLHGLEALVNKSLVELFEVELVEGEKRIRMHGHLRDMGREIASTHSPYRLWCSEKIDEIMKHSMKRKLIRGIQPADAFVVFKECNHQSMRKSSKLFSNRLQILSVKGNEFTKEFASLSESLVWLRWEDFPLRNFPSWLTLKNLSVLELRGADELEDLWQDNADPPLQLREFILEGCQKLQWLPSSIRCLRYLKRLVVEFHGTSFSEGLCGLQSLEYLRVHSPVLSSLPNGFGNLTGLTNIVLQSCKQLSTLPASFTQLIHLKILDLSDCEMLSSLPADFGNLLGLQNINLASCILMRTLPASFKQLIQVQHLNFSGCAELKLRSDILENIRKLEVLNLSNCEKLEDLPHQIMNQASLNKLYLQGCIELRGVPTNIGKLPKLDLLKIETLLWKHLQTSDENSSSLKRIEIVSTESNMASSITLKETDIEDLLQLSSLRINETDIENFQQLCTMAMSNDRFPNLESLVVKMNHYLMEIEMLPVSLKVLKIYSCNMLQNIRCFSGLINLEQLVIYDCLQIEELASVADFPSLQLFIMQNCPKVEKIEGLEHAKSLKVLSAQTSWNVPGILSLEKAERLEILDILCDTISALKPCIQSLKECPKEMWIQGSVIRLVEPVVDCVEFPDLVVREVEEPSEVDKICYAWELDAFLCYVDKEGKNYDKRTVVHMYYVVGALAKLSAQKFFAQEFPRNKARVVSGKRERVADAFYQLLDLLE